MLFSESGWIDDQPDFYAHHLAEINATNTVLTTHDICNEKGMIIVARGTPVTHDVAEKIARFRLLTPLENSVSLENTITHQALYTTFMQLVEAYHQYGASRINGKELDMLRQCCLLYDKFPLLKQKLTIFSEQLPDIYKDSLIVSFISMRIAYQLNLGKLSVGAVFLGGLMHDAGMLNLDPAFVNKQCLLTDMEQKNLQAHTAIASYFLDLVPDLPKITGRAVLEHHERINGTGYPHGKTEDNLCTEGQIIGLADSVNTIFHRKLKPRGYKVKDCVPILQMTRHFFPVKILDALLWVLHNNDQPTGRAFDNSAVLTLTHTLMDSQKSFSLWFSHAKSFAEQHIIGAGLDNNRQVCFMLKQLEITIRSSGLLTTELTSWLMKVAESEAHEDFQEIEYTALMFEELHYQFQQLSKMVSLIITLQGDESLLKPWEELTSKLNALPVVTWNH